MMSFIPRLSAVLVLVLAGSAAATTIPAFKISGRVAVSEPHSCDGGGGTGDLTMNELLSWTECHAFKQHMDASGNPITVNAFDSDALRPLSVTVEIEVWCTYNRESYGDAVPGTTIWVQTIADGSFKALVPQTACAQSSAADGVMVRTTAWLKYDVTDSSGIAGTVRAIWDKSQGMTVYNSVLSAAEPVLFSENAHDYVTPRFILQIRSYPLPMPSPIALGNQVFFDGAAPYYYDYLRGALGAWQTLTRLHGKLANALAVDGHQSLYRKMFLNEPTRACANCYSVNFINAGGGGTGGAGGFSLQGPTTSESMPDYGGLVSVGLPAHEFGHSMHGTIAGADRRLSHDLLRKPLRPSTAGIGDGVRRGFRERHGPVLPERLPEPRSCVG
jgi:hypothetical protein